MIPSCQSSLSAAQLCRFSLKKTLNDSLREPPWALCVTHTFSHSPFFFFSLQLFSFVSSRGTQLQLHTSDNGVLKFSKNYLKLLIVCCYFLPTLKIAIATSQSKQMFFKNVFTRCSIYFLSNEVRFLDLFLIYVGCSKPMWLKQILI